MRWETNLKERAFQFGLTLLKLHPRIARLGPQYATIALQLVRAGSSIGAHLEEGDVAASRRDMALKQAVGLREARESKHWLRMLIAAEVLVDELTRLFQESGELVAMLTTAVKKLRDDS
jgi:four helix bundle protein